MQNKTYTKRGKKLYNCLACDMGWKHLCVNQCTDKELLGYCHNCLAGEGIPNVNKSECRCPCHKTKMPEKLEWIKGMKWGVDKNSKVVPLGKSNFLDRWRFKRFIKRDYSKLVDMLNNL